MRLQLIIIFTFCFAVKLFAQTDKQQLTNASVIDTAVKIKADTAIIAKDTAVKTDSLVKKKHDPSKATFRSAVLPGWGQAYNKQYWKIPVVYAALGITAGTFVYNNKWYQRTKEAYDIVVNNRTADFDKIDSKLIDRQTGQPFSPETLQFYRNDFRRNRDYSVLYFLIAWGLNVVDATVFGHLKDFDVSDDLSMHINPTFDATTKKPGLGIAFNLKTNTHRTLPVF